MKIDISKGRYWDRPWSLVESCTRCSLGCDHCWALAMEKRFHKGIEGQVFERDDRLEIPARAKKPTVFSVWNDAYHEAVTNNFRVAMYAAIAEASPKHTFLILTKRPKLMAQFWNQTHAGAVPFDNVYHGLTVCNQQEADEKIPVFLRVPGKKFLSIEPCLGPVDLTKIQAGNHWINALNGNSQYVSSLGPILDAVILGGETGPGARPMNPDWVRGVRDQCAAAGVPFFFKQWGEWGLNWLNDDSGKIAGSEWMDKMGKKAAGRVLDGRTYDDLPWVKP